MARAIRFHGTYRYASRSVLAAALGAARQRLDDEDEHDPALLALGGMSSDGTELSVDVVLPAAMHLRFAAAAVFEILAEHAVAGTVSVCDGARAIDEFPCGVDD